MKNPFYSTLKTLFVLKIFKFLSWLWSCRKTAWLERQVNFKIYGVATCLKNICNTHIANISRSKGNQAIRFGQLIEYNMRDIFLKQPYTKCGRETIPKPLKMEIEQISGSIFRSFILFFLLFAKLSTVESDWNQVADHLFLPHRKLF